MELYSNSLTAQTCVEDTSHLQVKLYINKLCLLLTQAFLASALPSTSLTPENYHSWGHLTTSGHRVKKNTSLHHKSDKRISVVIHREQVAVCNLIAFARAEVF